MFIDRKDAAIKLAVTLEKYKGKDVLVLGIPRGGAETGYYVAEHLKATFSLLISRKLGHPDNPEFALGAIAEDGSTYFQSAASEVSPAIIKELVRGQKEEIRRRIDVLREGQPPPEIKARTVILVDDGIATGSTVFAAIRMCRNQGAGRVVVAAPVASPRMVRELQKVADEVVILEEPHSFFAVSQAYENFYNLTDEEARSFLERWKKERNVTSGS